MFRSLHRCGRRERRGAFPLRRLRVPSPDRSALIAGARAAGPICLGYLPIGLAFGVLAQKAGLAPWQVAAMSVLVFAGSAQFIAVAMLQEGAAAAAIVVTTLVINLRHFLMSSALSVPLRGRGRGFLALFAYGVTDESFAVNSARFHAAGSNEHYIRRNGLAG